MPLPLRRYVPPTCTHASFWVHYIKNLDGLFPDRNRFSLSRSLSLSHSLSLPLRFSVSLFLAEHSLTHSLTPNHPLLNPANLDGQLVATAACQASINQSTTAVDQRPRYRGNSGRAAFSLASLGSPSILGSLLLRKNRRHPVPNPLALARSAESSRPPEDHRQDDPRSPPTEPTVNF